MRTWTKYEIDLIGTMPDSELAERIGKTRKQVAEKRRYLGIKPIRSDPHAPHKRRKSDPRNQSIKVMVSKEEHGIIFSGAERAGESASVFVRSAAIARAKAQA